MALFEHKDCPTGATDWYFNQLVPTDPHDNVRWRRWLLEKGYASEENAREIWMMCKRDILFYTNSFIWILEARKRARWQPDAAFGNAHEIPFITRWYQDEALLKLGQSWGERDMLFFKSREMGATWMILAKIDHEWRFEPQSHFGLVSKDEKSADNPDDPDSLMSKLDFIHERLPGFLQPLGGRSRNVVKHTIKNRENGSTVTGYACTADVGRGGRKKVFVLDEMHSWPAEADYAAHDSLSHVTHCRVMISTPKRDRGQAGAFYDAVMDTTSDMERIDMDWKDDEEKSTGLYTSEGSTVIRLDPGFTYPEGYRFVVDGKVRSPYYDWECSRPLATIQSIAAELDKDFGGATNKFFNPQVLHRALANCRKPTHRASLLPTDDGKWFPTLIEDPDGDIDLWAFPESGIRVEEGGEVVIPEREYAGGWDIAQGINGDFSSYSAGCLFDKSTGEQVAQWRGNRIPVHELPFFAVALSQAFRFAMIAPEATGVGNIFINVLLKPRDGGALYTNIWYRPTAEGSTATKTSYKVGYDNKDGGKVIFTHLQNAIQLGRVKIRSVIVIQECDKYYIDGEGKLKHPKVGKGRSNTHALSHGDCAIAAAVGWYSIHTEPAQVFVPEPDAIPEESWLYRRQRWENSHRTERSYWKPFVDREVKQYLET